MKNTPHVIGLFLLLVSTGCASSDILQAHKGRMFDRTGGLALWIGGHGFKGPVLGPGTYYTGVYDEIYMVDCSTTTVREPLTALTKDGVQFGLDIYVRFSAECSDKTVAHLLSTGIPDKEKTISAGHLYSSLVRPAVGEAVREVVSPYRANDLNEKREELLTGIRKRFMEIMESREKSVIDIYEVNLSNLDFPDAMDAANVERAVQGVLKDKAIAERERVQAEIQTTIMRRELSEKEGEVAAAKIEKVGAALKRNPDYLQYDMQMKLPEIYRTAGANGNMVITAPSPNITLAAHPSGNASPPSTPPNDAPPPVRANPLDSHATRSASKDP